MYNAQLTKNRIKEICKEKRINMETMLTDCGLGVNAIRQINNVKGMASFSLAKIADYLSCSVDYLLGRTDIIEVNRIGAAVARSPTIEQKKMISADERVELKIVGKAAAGTPLEMVANNCELLRVSRISRPGVKLHDTDIVVQIQGNSMIEAGIDDGELAVIRPCPVAENGQIALVAVDGGSTLKKFYLTDSGVELHSCNPTYEIQRYGYRNDIRIIGIFVCTCEGDIVVPD